MNQNLEELTPQFGADSDTIGAHEELTAEQSAIICLKREVVTLTRRFNNLEKYVTRKTK